jgi:formylmethanofuran dehydrogenase subunit C
MAIALRGAAAVPAGNPTTNFTVTVPATSADDLLFLAVTSRDSTGAGTLSVTDNDTGGNTWTKIANSTDHKATLWYKRATSGTAAKTVTLNNAVGSCSGVLKCFSGADTGATPYTNVAVETNASTDETHAGITPANADSMVCCSVHNYNNDNAVTSLSFATLGATTMTEKLSTGGNDCATAYGHALQSGGPAATGNLTWAQTDGTTYSIVWAIKVLVPPISGTLTKTLAALTVVAAGTVAVTGASAKTLGTLTSASAGTVPVVGSATKTLGTLTASSAGTVADQSASGTLAQTLGSLTLASAGDVDVAGALARTLAALSSSSAGTVAVQGATTRTLGTLSNSSAGTITVTGAFAKTFGTLTTSSVGQALVAGATARTLGTLEADSAGTVALRGATVKTLGVLTLSGAGVVGTVPITGTLAATLGALTGDSNAAVLVNGATDRHLSTLLLVSAGTVADEEVVETIYLRGLYAGSVNLIGTSSSVLYLRGLVAPSINLRGVEDGVGYTANISDSDNWSAGEGKSLVFTIYQSGNVLPQDVTGWALSWTLTTKSGSLQITKTTANGGITLTAPASGVITVSVPRADTLTLSANTYLHELWRTDTGFESKLSSGIVVIES